MPVVHKSPGGRPLPVHSDCCGADCTMSLAYYPIRWVMVCERCRYTCGVQAPGPFLPKRP